MLVVEAHRMLAVHTIERDTGDQEGVPAPCRFQPGLKVKAALVEEHQTSQLRWMRSHPGSPHMNHRARKHNWHHSYSREGSHGRHRGASQAAVLLQVQQVDNPQLEAMLAAALNRQEGVCSLVPSSGLQEACKGEVLLQE